MKKLYLRIFASIFTALAFAVSPSLPAVADGNQITIECATQVSDVLPVEAFTARYPQYTLSIIATGAGQSITALRTQPDNPALDIAGAGRDLRAGEDVNPTLLNYLIGREVVCLIVNNAQTNLNNITLGQVQGIYNGTITDWSVLGGMAGAIVPRSRNLDSGLYKTFTAAGAGGWFADIGTGPEDAVINATGLARLNSNQEMISAIAANPNQIGYIGAGAIPTGAGIKALNLSRNTTPPNYYAPTGRNVYSGNYPSGRVLRVFARAQAEDPNWGQRIPDYVNFLISRPGQDAIKAAGAMKARPEADVNADGNVNIGDVVTIGLLWGASGAPGWTKEDVNGDGHINIGDVVTIGLWWGFTYTIPVQTG